MKSSTLRVEKGKRFKHDLSWQIIVIQKINETSRGAIKFRTSVHRYIKFEYIHNVSLRDFRITLYIFKAGAGEEREFEFYCFVAAHVKVGTLSSFFLLRLPFHHED